MQRILIFGNSGSGKSTLAKSYVVNYGYSHLDLDDLAWQDTAPPCRKPIEESAFQIKVFTDLHSDWVIEGCYTDLLELVLKDITKMIFLNPGIETCIDNCKSRPWEPHKYPTSKQQDDNLKMLIQWVRNYTERTDQFSLQAHRTLFDSFHGIKVEYQSNLDP
jgi:adenylate kinase family enzyme